MGKKKRPQIRPALLRQVRTGRAGMPGSPTPTMRLMEALNRTLSQDGIHQELASRTGGELDIRVSREGDRIWLVREDTQIPLSLEVARQVVELVTPLLDVTFCLAPRELAPGIRLKLSQNWCELNWLPPQERPAPVIPMKRGPPVLSHALAGASGALTTPAAPWGFGRGVRGLSLAPAPALATPPPQVRQEEAAQAAFERRELENREACLQVVGFTHRDMRKVDPAHRRGGGKLAAEVQLQPLVWGFYPLIRAFGLVSQEHQTVVVEAFGFAGRIHPSQVSYFEDLVLEVLAQRARAKRPKLVQEGPWHPFAGTLVTTGPRQGNTVVMPGDARPKLRGMSPFTGRQFSGCSHLLVHLPILEHEEGEQPQAYHNRLLSAGGYRPVPKAEAQVVLRAGANLPPHMALIGVHELLEHVLRTYRLPRR